MTHKGWYVINHNQPNWLINGTLKGTTKPSSWAACGVTDIVVENRLGNSSSNPGWGYLDFSLC